MAGLYVHIPFCKCLCGYCDFFKSVSLLHKDEMVESIMREMEYNRRFFENDALRTIYIGGGTPTVYEPYVFQRLVDKADELWGCGHMDEFTVEANPDDLTEEYLEKLSHTKVNRLSIGVQSFYDDDLRLMNRRHDVKSAINSVNAAKRAGYDNITIDLIYGIPGMTLERWHSNLEKAIDLGVQHISAYHLTIEKGTMFYRKGIGTVDESSSENQYMLLHEMLTGAGYEHYEISNFALEGYRSKHNSSYWNLTRYLGVGPSAHSFDGKNRRKSESSIIGYMEHSGSEALYDYDKLDEKDCYDEYLMLRLRTSEGINCQYVKERFGKCKLLELLSACERFIEAGILEKQGDAIKFKQNKWLISDSVISELFDV